MTEFQPGDRVTTFHGAYSGTVKDANDQWVTVCWDGEEDEGVLPGALLRHVPVTAEHVGQWARILPGHPAAPDGHVGEVFMAPSGFRGMVVVVKPYFLVDQYGAVLVAPPAPAPWSPSVGARAQVAVAQNGHGWSCRRVKDGEQVDVIGGPDVDGDFAVSNDNGDMGLVAARHLRPVPADQPDPAQDTGPEDWRDAAFRAFYEDWQERAARAVAAVNAEAGLRAQVKRLTAERDNAQRLLRHESEMVEATRDERDAARAELAAAHAHDTDGLGLPEVEVVVKDGVACAFVDGKAVATDLTWPHLNLQQRTAAVGLALLRARLADEATPEETGRG